MVTAFKSGSMELFTKENGSITKLKEKELFGMLKEIYTRANSKQIRRMASVFILT